MNKKSLSTRMKEYEFAYRTHLTRRMPLIIRIDGKAFHNFTKGFDKPFDKIMVETMKNTTIDLCKHIEGCVFGYFQSDEISLLLTDYNQLTTEAWFNKNLQKIVSVSASMATCYFNKHLRNAVNQLFDDMNEKYLVYGRKEGKALFDSRCFVLPKEEVCNYFVWRQEDAIRNSKEALGQAHFTQKMSHKKNCTEIVEMLKEKNIFWDKLPLTYRQGGCIILSSIHSNDYLFDRSVWKLDENVIQFKCDRNYIERLI